MITTPDTNDAVATCPPLSPPGPIPQGFFADCNPGANFPGTRPIAEHFNELILNLHALLVKGSIAPLKGDPTMLWRAVLGVPLIRGTVTFQVAPTGTATPANPFAGDPFDSVGSALTFLSAYRVLATGIVTIQVAAGTYTATTRVNYSQPNEGKVDIVGAGSSSTILRYNGCAGLWMRNATLRKLTLQGDGVGSPVTTDGVRFVGLYGGIAEDVVIQGFAGTGVYVGACCSAAISASLQITNCGAYGIRVDPEAFLTVATGVTLTLQNCGGGFFVQNASADLDQLITQGGTRGVLVSGAGAQLTVFGRLQVLDCTATGSAVQVDNGGCLRATGTGNVWEARTATSSAWHTFLASNYGMIFAGNQLAAGNRAVSSPLPNTLGNVQSWITP